MATDAFAKAFITILPDMTKFAAATRASAMVGIGGLQKQADNAAKGIGTRFLLAGQAVMAGVRKMTLGIGLIFAAVAVNSVHMAARFQAIMTTLHTQAGVSSAAVKDLSQRVLDLAGKVGQDPDSLAQALYHIESNFASMGISGQKAMDLLRVAAEGARIGHADLVDVTNALGAAVAANIPGVQNFDQAMGALNATVGTGDMTMQNLADAFGTGMVAVVKGFGLSIKDVGAALAVFGDNNIRGALAGNQLRMTVQALAKPVKTGEGLLKSVGLTLNSLGEDMQKGGLNLALKDMKKHMEAAGITGVKQGQFITNVFGRRAGTGVNILIDQFTRLQSKYKDLSKGTSRFGEDWKATQETFAQQWAQLVAGLKADSIKLGIALLPAATALVKMFNEHVIPAIQAFGNWVKNNTGTFKVLAAIVGGVLLVAFGAWAVELGIAAAEMIALTWPVLAVIAAIAALVAGLAYAYKHWEWFRKAVKATTDFLTNTVWPALKTGLHGIIVGFEAVGKAAVWLWQNAIVPAWHFINTVIRDSVGAIEATIRFLVRAWHVLADAAMWLWHHVIDPVWHGIVAVIHGAGAVISAIFKVIVGAYKILGNVIMFFWNNFWKPVWDRIVVAFRIAVAFIKIGIGIIHIELVIFGRVVQWLWNNAVKPAIHAIGDVFVWLYRNVVIPVFHAIQAVISFAWNSVIKPTFNYFMTGIRTLASVMQWLWRNVIQPVWHAIATGISWTWNNLIKPVFTALGNFIKNNVVPAFKTGVTAIADAWKGIQRAAQIPVEFVVNTVINKGIIDTYNKIAKLFLGPGHDVAPVKLPWAKPSAGATPFAHGLARGGVFNRPTAIVGEGHTSSPEYVIPTDPAHRARALSLYQDLGSKLMARGGILGGIVDLFTHPFSGVTGLIKKIGSNPFAQILGGMARKLVTSALGAVGHLFGSIGAQPGAGSGVTRWTNTVLQALAIIGQPASLLQTVLNRMQRESGGNQFAINNWDINAQRGDPSRGLMQTIMATFRAYHWPGTSNDIYDPLANILASMNYAMQRYGSLSAAYNRAGGYARGGIIGYDDGGMLPPGLSLAYNGTGRPEPVGASALTVEDIQRAVFLALAQASREGMLTTEVRVDGSEFQRILNVHAKRTVATAAASLQNGRR